MSESSHWRPENHPDLWRVVPLRRGPWRRGWHAKATPDLPAVRTGRHEPREPLLKIDPLGDALMRARQCPKAP